MDYRIFYVITLTLAVTLHLQKNPEATIGDYCEGNNCTATEICNADNKCECSSDSYQSRDECLSKASNGENCSGIIPCQDGLSCDNNICRCPSGYYYDGTNTACMSSSTLVPTISTLTATYSSFTVSWSIQENDPSDYTSSYTIDYNGTEIPINITENSLTQTTRITDGVNSNTPYNVIIRRKLSYDGTLESTLTSATFPVTTKSSHNEACTSNDDCTKLPDSSRDLVCKTGGSASVCLCPDGTFYDGRLPCISSSTLLPTISTPTSTYSSFTVLWSIQENDPSDYNSAYSIDYNGMVIPINITENSLNQTTRITTGVTSNTPYNVIIRRKLSYKGTLESILTSAEHQVKTKSSHNEACTSNDDCAKLPDPSQDLICKTGGSTSVCLCPDGTYYNGGLPCITSSTLIPTISTHTSTYFSFTVMWSIRANDPIGYTSAYTINYEGTDISINTENSLNQTTMITTGVNSNTLYDVIIRRKLSYDGKLESILTSAAYQLKTKSSHNEACTSNDDCAKLPDPSQDLVCKTGGSTSVCLCPDGTYYNGGLPCITSSTLIPTISTHTSTYFSFTVMWSIRANDPIGYTSAYTIDYEGTDISINTENSLNQTTMITTGVNSITLYDVIIRRKLSYDGKLESILTSAAYQLKTKSSHNEACTSNDDCAKLPDPSQDLVCKTGGSTSVCLCPDGTYYNGGLPCITSSTLIPTISTHTSTYFSFTVMWSIRANDPIGYTSAYTINYEGTDISINTENSLNQTTMITTGVNSNTPYDVIIRRKLSYDGKLESILTSAAYQLKTKSSHNEACTSNDDCAKLPDPSQDLVCKTGGSTSVCLCPDGTYYNGGLPCITSSTLIPTISTHTSTYFSFTVMWSIRANDPIGYTSAYTINYEGTDISINTENSLNQTTMITTGVNSNTPYDVIIRRKLSYDGKLESILTSAAYQLKTKSSHNEACTSNDDCAKLPDPSQDHVCKTGGSTSVCLCPDGTYYNGGLPCITSSTLLPSISSHISTYSSFAVMWSKQATDPSGYTSAYTIDYEGTEISINTENSLDQTTTITDGVTSNTPYDVIIRRKLSYDGTLESTLTSAAYPVKTKSSHNEACTSNNDCAKLPDPSQDLVCKTGGSTSVCLCPNGTYYNGNLACLSITDLIPTFSLSSDRTNIHVTLTYIPDAGTLYTSTFEAQVTPGSAQNIPPNSTTIPGLTEGTMYSVTVTRTLTLNGVDREQTTNPSKPQSISTKVSYNNTCSRNGICIDDDTDCHNGRCLCNHNYYWRGHNCMDINELAPGSVQAEVLDTTSVKVTWQPSTHSSFVSAYRVDAHPTDTSDPDPSAVEVLGGGATTTTLTGLQPGTRFRFTVESKSTNDGRVEYVSGNSVDKVTRPAKIERLDEVNSNFSAPDMKIAFRPAVPKFTTYLVTLNGENDGFSERKTATYSTEGYYFAVFGGVTTGNYYTVTVVTNSVDFSMSEPFTKRQRVMADQASGVQNLAKLTLTSRSVEVRWTQPAKPNGRLFEYSLEIRLAGTCISRIVFNCTSCPRNSSVFDDTAPLCPPPTTIVISEEHINDKDYEVRHNVTSLDPDTSYSIQAIAYNEGGRGKATSPLDVHTESEPARKPKSVTTSDIKANTLTLTWVPEIPRPGNTRYVVEILERNEDNDGFHTFRNETVFGYDTKSLTVPNLSSYWQYQFSVLSQSEVPPVSDSVRTNVIRTLESVTDPLSAILAKPRVNAVDKGPVTAPIRNSLTPTRVLDLTAEEILDVYDKVKLRWECPPQKDGRNGVILNATVKYETDTLREGVTPTFDKQTIKNPGDCSWNVELNLTPEFNYTFTVYISNSIPGASRVISKYMPPGPAVIREGGVSKQQKEVSEKENSFPFTICPRCLRDGRNGLVESSGILVCKNTCPTTQKKRETITKDHYEQVDNWQKASAANFNNLFRVTTSTWLDHVPLTDQDNWVYEIGLNSSCDRSDESGFCNGPLPEGSTYLVIVFVCTAAGCDESEPVSIKTKEPPSHTNVIVGAVCGVLAAIVIVIAVIVFLKWRNKVIRPPSQENRRPRYVSDTADKDDTYEEIADGNIQSVVQDGRPEVDYYNMRDNPPRIENIYDQLRVYSNQGQHDYGRIKVTQT